MFGKLRPLRLNTLRSMKNSLSSPQSLLMVGWEIQVVADQINGYYGKPIDPNLEHAYVHFMENKIK